MFLTFRWLRVRDDENGAKQKKLVNLGKEDAGVSPIRFPIFLMSFKAH